MQRTECCSRYEPTVPAYELPRTVEMGTTNGVNDEINAARSSALHPRDNVLAVVINGMRAVVGNNIVLGLRCRSLHLYPKHASQIKERAAGRACRPMHQHGRARMHVSDMAEDLVRGEIVHH